MSQPLHQTPPQQMVALLAGYKATGRYSFTLAWNLSISRIQWSHDSHARKMWGEVLQETRGEWEAAWDDHPTDASARLAGFDDYRVERTASAIA